MEDWKQKSQLQVFFKHNLENPDEMLLYQEMARFCSWDNLYMIRAFRTFCFLARLLTLFL